MAKKSGLPRGVTEFQDRHGKWHLRYRAKGQPTVYLKTRPGQEGWAEEIRRARAGEKATPAIRTSARTKPGTISALIAVYYGTPEFTGLADSSKGTYRNMLERFREEHGDKMVATLSRAHIKAIIGGMHETPSAANNLLDRLRILMKLAMDDEWRQDDPTYRVSGFKVSGEGFHTWSEDEIAKYCQVYPPGSSARLAMTLMLYTGQRRSDMVKMGWQHIEGNRIRVRQIKTDAMLSIGLHPVLAAELALAKKSDLTILLTQFGKPFTANGFGNRMRKWCDSAGLAECTSHGLRKAAARRLAEAGCSNKEIMAITGHQTDKEVTRYTKAADQKRLADRAMKAIGGG
ncbi:tyrosine recombinase XerC [Devosia honganensis]|uniref:Tyrosine recombinase XerC n=1 Tax=Devosia honganensis TaxID=1610527 RepID=A0ABV7X4J3_9HYPH